MTSMVGMIDQSFTVKLPSIDPPKIGKIDAGLQNQANIGCCWGISRNKLVGRPFGGKNSMQTTAKLGKVKLTIQLFSTNGPSYTFDFWHFLIASRLVNVRSAHLDALEAACNLKSELTSTFPMTGCSCFWNGG